MSIRKSIIIDGEIERITLIYESDAYLNLDACQRGRGGLSPVHISRLLSAPRLT